MKKAVCLVLLLMLSVFAVSCNQTNTDQPNAQKKNEIMLTNDNFDDYFYTNITHDINMGTDMFGKDLFTITVLITFDLKQTADIKNIVVEGILDLDVSETHLLHKEGKLPKSFKAEIYASGHGETTVSYSFNRGAYGGFEIEDYFIEVENITGSIIIRD